MPISGWIVDDADGQERVFTSEELLDYAKGRPEGWQWTYEVVKLIIDGQQDRGDHLSTTALTGECDLNFVLERKSSYVRRLDDEWASFTGSMYHEQLEKASIPGQTVVERRYWLELEGLGWVSCKPDVIDIHHGILGDYKTKSKALDPRRRNPYDANIQQLNVNRYIVDHAEWIEFDEQGDESATQASFIYPYHKHPEVSVMVVPVVEGETRPYEWSHLEAIYLTPREGMQTLMCSRSIDVPRKDGKGTKKARVPWIWSDSEAETFIRERYA